MIWVNALVQGILLGGLYALFATGLSLVFGVMRLVNLAHGDLGLLAAFLLVGLQLLISRTRLGRALRATADDLRAAELMGIDHRRTYAYAMGIALATVAIAGVFFGMRTTFAPSDGPVRLIFAFEAVIIGGLGSLWGTLVGGIVLGVAQTIGAEISVGWGGLAGPLVF